MLQEWNCIIPMFLTSFNVYFALGYAYFMCIRFDTAIWLFLVKTGWQPCYPPVRRYQAGEINSGIACGRSNALKISPSYRMDGV